MTFTHAISWFEIPATDLGRAQKFYETIFDMEMIPMDLPNIKMRMFPIENMMTGVGVHFAIVADFINLLPTDGPLIYLNANPDVQIVLDRIEAAGGKIIVPKTLITDDIGHMAVFIDTEGNRIALHSIPG